MNTIVWAYVDPGTGSIILQVIIGGLLGASYYMRNRIKRLRGTHAKDVRPLGAISTDPFLHPSEKEQKAARPPSGSVFQLPGSGKNNG